MTFPSQTATLSIPYIDDASQNRTWTGTALAVPLQGSAQYQSDGKWIREGYTVTIDQSTLDPRKPEQGDVVYVQFGQDAAFPCVVINALPVRDMYLTLTIERRFV